MLSDYIAAEESRVHFRERDGVAYGVHLNSSLCLLARFVKQGNYHAQASGRGMRSTGTPFYMPLLDFVLTAHEATPKIIEKCFFGSGEPKLWSSTDDWQRALKGVFKEAGIPDRHAHRIRDAFAVDSCKLACQ